VSDWDKYTAITKSLLDRFITADSIFVQGETLNVQPVRKNKQTQDALIYSIPSSDITKLIRECWTDDRRSIPRQGIIFPDGSIMTVLFVAKRMPFEKLLAPVSHHTGVHDQHGQLMGFVEKYSYCFYPNSKVADQIGYFRYDFHAEKMGDGDLGEHNYFHFHRQLEDSYRHATGPILDFGEIVSGLEKVLAPKQRRERLKKAFNTGEFDALIMDLTLEGIEALRETLYPSKSFKDFRHKKKYDDFLENYMQ